MNLIEFGIPEAMWHLRVNRFPGDRDHGRAWQQSACGRGEGDGGGVGASAAGLIDWACIMVVPRGSLFHQDGQIAQLVERSPEKAGVGGSIPSLATIFSIAYRHPKTQFHSVSFQNYWSAEIRSRNESSWEPAESALETGLQRAQKVRAQNATMTTPMCANGGRSTTSAASFASSAKPRAGKLSPNTPMKIGRQNQPRRVSAHVARRHPAPIRRAAVLGARPPLARGRSRNTDLPATPHVLWDQLAISHRAVPRLMRRVP